MRGDGVLMAPSLLLHFLIAQKWNSANFAFWSFSEVPHSPGPIQQMVLCRVSKVRSLLYIRNR
jgi:hypothetical protein